MRHDCQATEEKLVDLLFGEAEGGRRATLLEEVVQCETCACRYRSMAETLRVFDEAAEKSLPAEDFWAGYEERLRRRMAQEIRTDFWGRPVAGLARGEYRLTFVEDEGLARRLARELRAGAGLTWSEFRRDPFTFILKIFEASGRAGWAFFSQRNVATATASAFVFVTLLLGTVFALERLRMRQLASANSYENLEIIGWVDPENPIPREQPTPEPGAAGMNEGKGGGSKPKYERPAGGGGGGRQEQSPASHGKLPTAQLEVPPILTASPKPPPPNPHLPAPVTMQIDPLLVRVDPRDVPYGLPNSTETAPSSGPGKGGGMGEGTGGGMGPGAGAGLGPGRDGNHGGGERNDGGGGPGGAGGGGIDYDRPFRQNEVSQRALITFKPEPGFTEEARRNNVTGLVRLRAILSSSGAVTNISVVKGLPDGLTEKAIAAARQIKFRPAQKDGRAVSQYVVLEYNFNIY